MRSPLWLVLEQAHGGDGVGRVHSEAVVYTVRYQLLTSAKAGFLAADANIPCWQDDQVALFQCYPDPLVIVLSSKPCLLARYTTDRSREGSQPRTSKYPDPPRIYRISSSSCRCLKYQLIPHRAGEINGLIKERLDLGFVSLSQSFSCHCDLVSLPRQLKGQS